MQKGSGRCQRPSGHGLGRFLAFGLMATTGAQPAAARMILIVRFSYRCRRYLAIG